MAPMAFGGFPSEPRATAIPNLFFTTLMPEMTDPAELIVSCYLFFALGQQRGTPRVISYRALAAERPLLRALASLARQPEEALKTGLSLAVARGTLLVTGHRGEGGSVYLFNTAAARRRLAAEGAIAAADEGQDEAGVAALTTPDIYKLYEENIGTVSPLLIDELDDAAREFPAAWIEAAFREAAANNRRNWRYISRILQRWSVEGPNYETTGRRASLQPAGRRRTIGGPYRRVVERPRRD